MDVPSLLKQARAGAGLTQAQLASRAGTSQAAVARYESGAASPAVDTLTRLMAVCGRVLVLSSETRGEAALNSPRYVLLRRHRKEIRKMAAEAGARNVRVFGSVVRGEDQDGSDIDLLVDFDTKGPDGLWPLVQLKSQLDDLLGERVDVVPAGLLRREVAEAAHNEAITL